MFDLCLLSVQGVSARRKQSFLSLQLVFDLCLHYCCVVAVTKVFAAVYLPIEYLILKSSHKSRKFFIALECNK